MPSWLTPLLTDPASVPHILLVYAVVISAGMAVGHIRLFGVSLGATCVLFLGLVAGHLGFAVSPSVLGFLRDFGLILFVFFIGLQVGPSFFSSFRSGGVELNILAILGVFLSLAVTIAITFLVSGSISLPQMLGVHFGAVTNTPGLGATQEALDMLGYAGEDIAVGYACAYPLGVLCVIASALILRLIFRIDIREEDRHWEEETAELQAGPVYFQVRVTNAALDGRTIEELRTLTGRQFICSRILHRGAVTSPNAQTVVHEGDILRIVSEPENQEAIVVFCGELSEGDDLTKAHSPITSRIVRVTRESVNGIRISELHLSRFDGVNITRVFRAGMTLFPYRNLHLQLGDGVLCVGPENAIGRLAGRLGNQEKQLDHPNIISIFLGMAVGILFGSLPIAIPGMPAPLKLGLAGGPLIVAILLGYFGPRFRLVTYTTHSAALMLQEFGITLFLASVGLSAGESFFRAVTEGNGLTYMGLGVFITLIPLLVIGVLARVKYKFNYLSIVGLLAGSTTNPPTLAYGNTLSDKNAPAIAYSTVYPMTMFLRILSGQVVLLLFWSLV